MQHSKDTKKHKANHDGEKSRHIRNAQRSLTERKVAKRVDRELYRNLGSKEIDLDDWI